MNRGWWQIEEYLSDFIPPMPVVLQPVSREIVQNRWIQCESCSQGCRSLDCLRQGQTSTQDGCFCWHCRSIHLVTNDIPRHDVDLMEWTDAARLSTFCPTIRTGQDSFDRSRRLFLRKSPTRMTNRYHSIRCTSVACYV